jgi:nucleotide-binding universal stress UspA family protein
MFKHILIPTDGSPLSTRAALAGVQLAAALGARVTGVFAAPPATPVIYKAVLPVGYATPREHAKMIRKAVEHHLGTIEKAALEAGVACDTFSVTSDFPADTILTTAQKRHCDLIVMASHSRKGLRGVLLGSETQKVLAGSRIPVLVYRGDS